MVYQAFDLRSTQLLSREEVDSFMPVQQDYHVIEVSMFHVECRIKLQYTESHGNDGWHNLYLVVCRWTVKVQGTEWQVFKHANGIRDELQTHESFLKLTGDSDGHATGPRLWYQIEEADVEHSEVVIAAREGEVRPFDPACGNLALLEGVCIIEPQKKWRGMLTFVLGHLLHSPPSEQFRGLGPIAFIPTVAKTKGKAGRISLLKDHWAYEEHQGTIDTVNFSYAERGNRSRQENSWFGAGPGTAAAASNPMGSSSAFMEMPDDQAIMNMVPPLSLYENLSPLEPDHTGTERPIVDGRTPAEHLLEEGGDILAPVDGAMDVNLEQFSPPERPLRWGNIKPPHGEITPPATGSVPLTEEETEDASSESDHTVRTSRWSRKGGLVSQVPKLPPPKVASIPRGAASSTRRPLDVSMDCQPQPSPLGKRVRNDQSSRVIRALFNLHGSCAAQQTEVDKAMAEAAVRRARLEEAMRTVPYSDEDATEWLLKWEDAASIDV